MLADHQEGRKAGGRWRRKRAGWPWGGRRAEWWWGGGRVEWEGDISHPHSRTVRVGRYVVEGCQPKVAAMGWLQSFSTAHSPQCDQDLHPDCDRVPFKANHLEMRHALQ